MSSNLSEKGQSIVEASLTELAFVFFFILLIFSALRINTLMESADETKKEQANFAKQHSIMRESLDLSKVDMEAPFSGIDETASTVTDLAGTVKNIESKFKNISQAELIKKIDTISRMEEKHGDPQAILDALDKVIQNEPLIDDFPKYLEDLKAQLDNTKGQNKNMRERLNQLGNGLVHPPCWADVNTGAIEYVYNVTIKENSLLVTRAWPDTREALVLRTPYISKALGEYSMNSHFLRATRALFDESKANNCRHFVRISDEAVSKDAFKEQLLTIENHFYKYLVP